MDSIESNIKTVLNGERLDDENGCICDYSLKQQINELASKGVESQVSQDFKPIVKTTVTYIVAAVLFNERSEVLLMQEAKSKYAGQWYLPAGRMEANEQIIDAVKREVLEETGLDFEPNTLLLVESSHGNWFRFVFTGHVIGGQLKTVSQADSESLQACWVADIKQLSLRSNDCLKLIDYGRQYVSKKAEWHRPQLSVVQPHHKLLLRTVVVIRKRMNNRIHILISETASPHLPVSEINPTRSLHAALKRFMQFIFSNEKQDIPEHKPIGILSVEHNGVPANEHDGLCLSLLVLCKKPLEEAVPRDGYTWLQVESELETLLISKISKPNQIIGFNVI